MFAVDSIKSTVDDFVATVNFVKTFTFLHNLF